MTDFIQVITTIDKREEADKIAGELVARRLAACVQVLGPVQSTYHWQGKIETAQEWLGHSSTTHTRRYIDAEDYREKANGVVAGLDI